MIIDGYSVTNEGTIGGNGTLNLFDVGGGTTNGGTISTTNVWIGASGAFTPGAFINDGTISATSLTFRDRGAFFINDETISATSLDVYSYDDFINKGTINGGGNINCSGQSFDNEGTISAANGETLSLEYFANINNNNGIISVGSGSHLYLQGSGSLGGTGSFVINGGGTLGVTSTLSNTVNFAGVGTLQLDGPNLFTGSISGLTTGDVIDFPHVTVTNAVVNNNVLTVTFVGGATENLTLAAPLPAGDFLQTAFDGAGGTKVVVADVTISPPPTYRWLDGTTGDWGTASNWSGGITPDGTSNAVIGGSGTETVTVSANQAVNVLTLNDANATLVVNGGLSVYGGLVLSAIHEIDVSGTLLVGRGSQTLDNATINLGSPSSYGQLTTDTASQTPTVLTLGPNLTVNDVVNGIISSGYASGDGVDNQGAINVKTLLIIEGNTISNEGSIVGSGAVDVIYSSSLSVATEATLLATQSLTIDGQQFHASGAFTNNGTISSRNIDVRLGSGAFVNNGNISGNNLDFYYGSSFTNGKTGTISAEGNSGYCGFNLYAGQFFDNEGVISATSGDVLGLYLTSGVNNGTISVGSGSRVIFGAGSLSGTGSMVINDGGNLEVQSGNLSDNVNFAGIGTLQLDGPNLFTGSISGLTTGDAIDFAHASIIGAVVNTTTLTVTFVGGATENLTLAAPLPAGDNLTVELDGSGGNELVVTKATNPPALRVLGVTATTDSGATDLNAGHIITIGVATSELVTIAGSPTLALNDGGTAIFTGVSSTGTLKFSYIINGGDNAVDLQVVGIDLNGGSIQDDTGNILVGNMPQDLGVQVDTTPPTGPATPADSAVVNGYVNATQDAANQVLTGSAEKGSTVTIYDNTTQVGTTTANASTGAWSLPIGVLADGSTHTYTVTATDAAGNVSQPSPALSFVVDTTAPATPAAPADSAVVNGYVNAAHDTAQMLTGTAEDGSTVTIYDNTTQVGTTTANASTGAWSLPIGVLADGSTHTYTVTATDAAGNVSQPSPALSFVVDTTAPATPAAPADSAVVNGYVNAAHDTAQMLTGTAEDGSTVTIYDNTTQVGTTTANASTGAWSLPIGVLADGSTHTYTVTATDAAGNVSQPSPALSFVVDTTAPATPAAPADSAVVNGYVNAAHDTAQMLTGTAEDGSTVTIYDNTTQVGTTTANASTGAWSLPIGVLADGSTHTYTVTATDAAGNVSQPSPALSFVVDTTAPATPAAPADSAVVNGYVNAAHDTAQTLTGTAEDASTVTIYDNNAQVGTTTANASTGAWSLPIGVLADGSTPHLHGHRDRRGRQCESAERGAEL